MSRALAYCVFLRRPEISLPRTGVMSTEVRVIEEQELGLLWSEVEWPFNPGQMQKNAVEFHTVVHHILRQAAVVPFRLLSVFSDQNELAAFAAEHAREFTADLERLSAFVQMECVIYPAPGRAPVNMDSGAEYLRERAGMLRMIGQHVSELKDRLGPLAHDLRVRETRSGTRLFVLTDRGKESEFRSMVERVSLPGQLSRRMSGPWPATEFLSQQLKAPQIAGGK
jgi:gas vesicle protein GvpL/GvpF